MIKDLKHASRNDLLRRALNEQIGEPQVQDREWRLLQKTGLVDDVLSGRRDRNWLADRLWDLRGEYGGMPRADGGAVARANPKDAQQAISLVFAREAARDPEVIAFREQVLNGRLLLFEEVDAWVRSRVKPGTRWLRVPLPAASDYTLGKMGLTVDPPLAGPFRAYEFSGKYLALMAPGSETHQVRTTVGSELDKLRHISERLVKNYRWRPAQATVFILTDLVPVIPRIRTSTSSAAGGYFTLEVDATVTPRELAAAYARLRRRVFGTRRTKQLSEKHQRLAAFTASCPEGQDWNERLLAWNRANKTESYRKNQLQTFKRDCRAALERVSASKITDRMILGLASEKPSAD